MDSDRSMSIGRPTCPTRHRQSGRATWCAPARVLLVCLLYVDISEVHLFPGPTRVCGGEEDAWVCFVANPLDRSASCGAQQCDVSAGSKSGNPNPPPNIHLNRPFIIRYHPSRPLSLGVRCDLKIEKSAQRSGGRSSMVRHIFFKLELCHGHGAKDRHSDLPNKTCRLAHGIMFLHGKGDYNYDRSWLVCDCINSNTDMGVIIIIICVHSNWQNDRRDVYMSRDLSKRVSY